MKTFYLFICLIPVLLLSCTSEGIVNDFRDMARLKDSLLKTYPKQEINIKISNGYFISISFINSPLKDKSKEDKEKIAENVGVITRHFFDENRIKEGNLVFIIHKNFIIANYTEGMDVYDLKISPDIIESKDSL